MKYREIKEQIYQFYPKKCAFDSEEYQNSKEYKRYLEVIKDSTRREKIRTSVLGIIQPIFRKNCIVYRESGSIEPHCVHYSILLHEEQPLFDDDVELLEKLNGRRLDLELYVSLLTSNYYMYVVETKKEKESWEFQLYDEKMMIDKEKRTLIYQKFSEQGYTLLEKECVKEIVPSIETELCYEGEVRIFHCLFTEIPDLVLWES